MVLLPGDPVLEDTCESVGNFPHGILTNPDALALDPGVQGPVPALASNKANYITLFEERNLEVCNAEQFAVLHSPLQLKLQRGDGGGPGPDDPQQGANRYILAVYAWGNYLVISRPIYYYGGSSWRRTASYPAYSNDWSVGGFTLDLWNGPTLTIKDDQISARPYYANNTFRATFELNYSVYGLNGPYNEMIITLSSTFTIENDAGKKSDSGTYTSPVGSPFAAVSGGPLGETVDWVNEAAEPGYLVKTGVAYASFSVQEKYPGYVNNIP